MKPIALLSSCALFAAGCGIASADDQHHVPARSAQTAAQTPTRSATGTATTAPGQAAQAAPPAQAQGASQGTQARVHYDLATHIARAELWQGHALVMDHGVPGGAKYTLGGWLSSTGDDHDFAGVSTVLIPGTAAKLFVPIETAGATNLAIRARGFGRGGAVTIYLGGAVVGRGELPADGSFTTLRVSLLPTQLHAGENTLQLRATSTGSAAGLRGTAGIAVDWVRVGPADEPLTDDAPPAPNALVTRTGDRASVNVPAGWSVAWAMETPAAARFRTTVRGTGGHVEIVAKTDGGREIALANVTPSATGATVDADLTQFATRIVRITARATGSAAALETPAVVTLDGAAPAAARRPRNVLVYLIDTLRADKLRPINPRSRVQTPGLASFVEQATVMMGAHTQENWTKPSVATLLSSLFPWEHHATTTEAVVPETVRFMPEYLKERGFYTGAFIANGYASDRFGFRQGWSTWRNYVREGRPTRAQYVAADVLQWLDERPQDKPFMLYVHTIDPHVPYAPPDHFLQMYDAAPYAGVINFQGDSEMLEKVKSGRVRLGARDRTHLEALYDGEISYHDVHFNAIMQGLQSRGLADDTMIVVTADHGEEFWDHGSVGHGHSVYEELLHIPMFVKLPGVTNRTVALRDRVGLVDVMPTVLDALGQPIPDDLSGTSFLPLVRGETSDAPRAVVSGFMDGWRAVSIGRYKLIQRTAERMYVYDLERDPGEQADLAADHPIALRYLRGMLGMALAETEHGGTSPRARRPVIEQQTTTIDAETEAQLRALGYVGSSRR